MTHHVYPRLQLVNGIAWQETALQPRHVARPYRAKDPGQGVAQWQLELHLFVYPL